MAVQDVSRMLMGLSSGLQGRGNEFIRGQQQEQALKAQQQRQGRMDQRQSRIDAMNKKSHDWAMDENRRKAMWQDAMTVQSLISGGDIAGANELLGDREVNIQRLGGDPTQTMEIRKRLGQAAQSGDFSGFNSGLNQIVEAGYSAGFGKRPKAAGAAEVKSSEILPDGSVVMSMTDGSTRVVDSEGNQLKGKDRSKAVRAAREYGAEIQGERATARTLGTDPIKASIKLGTQAFEKIGGVRKNISNLDQVISAIDKGAGTGAVERFFPSIKSASIELDNLRNRLGLDIIGDVTFGALSQGELDLALDTALPTGLEGPELKQWAMNKKKAQEAYAREMEKAASFFSRGGNIADYIAIRKDQAPTNAQQQGASAAQGGQQPRSESDILNQYGIQ